MRTRSTTSNLTGRRVWLRRGGPRNPQFPGRDHHVRLTKLGLAAAYETFVTVSPHMSAIWTDLFESMLIQGSDLRWAGSGPGVGRDARIAYSSLFGRYMARAYLTSHEGVRVLVPLEVAKRRFQGTRFSIKKDPPGRGLLADWIGLDGRGLVIAEAKGTYDVGRKTWRGPSSCPTILRTAIGQAGRTAVYGRSSGSQRKLPAKRWAIASRWGTAGNPMIEPTLLAWDSGDQSLNAKDYRGLSTLLLRADGAGVVRGLGHQGAAATLLRGVMPTYMDRFGETSIAGSMLEPGFAAVAGPFGVLPLRDERDFDLANASLDLGIPIAIASMSARYLENVIGAAFFAREGTAWEAYGIDADERLASQGGLTVSWPLNGTRSVRGARD